MVSSSAINSWSHVFNFKYTVKLNFLDYLRDCPNVPSGHFNVVSTLTLDVETTLKYGWIWSWMTTLSLSWIHDVNSTWIIWRRFSINCLKLTQHRPSVKTTTTQHGINVDATRYEVNITLQQSYKPVWLNGHADKKKTPFSSPMSLWKSPVSDCSTPTFLFWLSNKQILLNL